MPSGDRAATSLALARFRVDFLEAFASRRLGGVSVLGRLATQMRCCIYALPPPQRAVAFALYAMLQALAEDRDERAVSMAEDETFFAAASQPMVVALEFLLLRSAGSAEDAIAVIEGLITVYETFIPPRS